MSFFLIVMYIDGGSWIRGMISVDVIGWLIGLLFVGVVSVYWWWKTGDLTYYAAVQFVPILVVFTMYWMKGWKGETSFMIALGLYILAKVTEYLDGFFFALTGDLISGHTIKHLLSALGVGILAMERCRS